MREFLKAAVITILLIGANLALPKAKDGVRYGSILMGAIGTAMGASAAKQRKKQLGDLVKGYKPLDVGATGREALTTIMQNAGLSGETAKALNEGSFESRSGVLEAALPGFQERAQLGGNALTSFLKGEVPQDVSDLISQRTSERAVGGGYSGSGLGRNLTARDLGRTSLDLITQGLQMTPEFSRGITDMSVGPMANATNFLGGLTTGEQVGLRTGEREDLIRLKMNEIGAPTSKEVWGQGLVHMSDQLMELAGSVLGSVGAMGACWVARAVLGESDGRWMIFRRWLLNDAPAPLRWAYLKWGERIASTVPAWPRWLYGGVRKAMEWVVRRQLSKETA